jgi:hypothetical protein
MTLPRPPYVGSWKQRARKAPATWYFAETLLGDLAPVMRLKSLFHTRSDGVYHFLLEARINVPAELNGTGNMPIALLLQPTG